MNPIQQLILAALTGGFFVKLVDYLLVKGGWTQTDKERLWTALGEANGHRAQLQQRLDQAEHDMHETRMRLALAERETESLRRGYNRLKQENEELRSLVSQMETDMAVLRDENAALRSELLRYEEAHTEPTKATKRRKK